MAVYKVPQDVEADDKLIGPFSFRQFIYLIVVAVCGMGGWGLFTAFPPLAVIVLPPMLFFGALALPLRKDQPMEAYLGAILSFYFLKSRRRFWEPDGIESFVTIIAPKSDDIKRVKDINQNEAEQRFSYLAGVVDSHGWAVRGQGADAPANLSSDLYYEAQQATDVMDNSASLAQGIDRKLQNNTSARREQLMQQMQKPTVAPASPPIPAQATLSTPGPAPVFKPQVGPAKPKPSPQTKNTHAIMTSAERDAITVARGLAEEAAEERKAAATIKVTKPVASTSVTPPSAATIDLATNRPDLSVQTISQEARRIEEKEKLPSDEVFVSLH